MERRRQSSVEQLNALVDFMELHSDLALGRLRSKEARFVADQLWRECAEKLNAEGPARTGKEWAKVWNDFKSRVRSKWHSIKSNELTSSGTSISALTPIEERVKNTILDKDIGPFSHIKHDPFASQDSEDVIEDVVADRDQDPLLEIQTENVEQQNVLLQEFSDETSQVYPTPNITGEVPSRTSQLDHIHRARRKRRRIQRLTARRAAKVAHSPSSNKTALEESLLMILKIESMRAEASIKNAESIKIAAEGFKLLADSLDRFTKQYSSSRLSSQGQRAAMNGSGNYANEK